MSKLDDFKFKLRDVIYKPIMIGGMGVDISTTELALVAARLGGIGHISDAMGPYVSDRKFKTRLQQAKLKIFKPFMDSSEKSVAKWDPKAVYEGTLNHVRDAIQRKVGPGGIFVNVMEKLTMGNPKETLKARLQACLDGGADGITLSAGLHKGTFELIKDHPRFRDVNLGIIVSSARALNIFIRSALRADRLPDYVVVEGPLAGGHLGFGLDWAKYNLKSIVQEVMDFLKEKSLDIKVIPAGGIFTGTEAVNFLKMGADAVQVATRFTIAKECGLPEKAKQDYLRANEDDVEVNMTSPTGYPMRMLKYSPSLDSNIRPNCESLGYLLDADGFCEYRKAYNETPVDENGEKLPVRTKMCICYQFMTYDCYTCGHNVYRLKDTTYLIGKNEWYLPPAEQIFNDYLYSENNEVHLPELPPELKDKVSLNGFHPSQEKISTVAV